jgi:hypothetical protein
MTSLLYSFYPYDCAAGQISYGSIIARDWSEVMKAAVPAGKV